jgi:general secretion pathway protein C
MPSTLTSFLTVPPASGKLWRRTAWVVNLAALALLSTELARLTWHLVIPANSPSPVSLQQGSADDSARLLLDAIPLFGLTAPRAEARAGSGNLINGLSLSGVVAAGRGSVALISVDGAPAEPFMIGQEISNDRHLHSAAEDHVLIRQGTATERLELSGRDGADAPATTAPVPAASPVSGGVEQIAPNRFILPRGLAEAQMRSPDFLRQAMMVPQPDGGFMVREITPGSLYEKLGLKAGDVIRSVNGNPVNNLEDAMQLYRRLGSAGQVTMDITRGGKVESLEYTIR